MKTLIATAIIASFGVASALAMPLNAPPQPNATPIIKVIEGCGPNGHRGPEGMCRPRWNCPPGWHPGPQGWHCFRN
jgi:hypothetical protein